ncbi:MAG: hypothetical protein ACE5I4_04265 [Thermoplasmata archaeon]
MLPDPVRRRAEEIAQDRTQGAFPLSLRALEAYERLGDRPDPETAEELHATLVSGQPWMVAVRNASLLAQKLLLEGRGEEIVVLRDRLKEARQTVARKAIDRIRDAEAVVTISYSSDVFEALSHPEAPKGLRVYVCESRPLQEGIQLASNLHRIGVKAIAVADAAGPTLVKQADAVLTGADSFLRRGSLVNKIGTVGLALASREFDVPFLPLLEVLKVELEGEEIEWKAEERDPAELSRKVEALNFYFEEVPGTLLEAVATDAGTERPAALLSRFRTLEDLGEFYLG